MYKYPKMTKVMQKPRTYGEKLNKRENITAFYRDFTLKSKKRYAGSAEIQNRCQGNGHWQ
jgi:hypothetical protein